MKNLVLLWGWVVFFPAVAPVIALPILILLGRMLRSLSTKLNTAVIFFGVCGILAGIAVLNFRYGGQYYFNFLTKNGKSHIAKVVEVRGAKGMNDTETTELTVAFANPEQSEVKVSFRLTTARIFPRIENVEVTPEVGDTIAIVVYPQAENVLMIDADPKKSAFGEKLLCISLRKSFKLAQLRISSADFRTPEVRANYFKAASDLLDTNCPTYQEREQLHSILSQSRR